MKRKIGGENLMSLAEKVLNKFAQFLTNDEIDRIASYEDDDESCKDVAVEICWDYIPESFRKGYFKYGTSKRDCLESYVQ